MASSPAITSPTDFYHVFINHRGPDVKKTLASHLYHRLCSAHNGLRVFFDKEETQVGHNLTSQIIDAIKNASSHVAIFSPRYGESEWCLKELVYMLDSGAPIIPVFYHVDPADLRWTHREGGAYTQGLRKLESRNDSTTIQKWREVLCRFADVSGLHLQETCNGDEGLLVEEIVQRVLKKIKRILLVQNFHCSQLHGGHGGAYWNDGTYSGIRRIMTTTNGNNWLTSIQLHYALEGDASVKDKYIEALPHGLGFEQDNRIRYDLNYPEEFLTKISGRLGKYGANEVIISLTFHTNQRDHGPCGLEVGTYFETEAGKIVGLFGSSGHLLDSIGLYMLEQRSSADDLSESV